MEKAQSSKLYDQAANQNKEADSHAHKILNEVSEWFKCTVQANQTSGEAMNQNVQENLNAISDGFHNACESASRRVHAYGAELKRENPEWVDFVGKASHLPDKAYHRIADFYRTRPSVSHVEVLLPPILVIDGLVRGGLPQPKQPLVATDENIRQTSE